MFINDRALMRTFEMCGGEYTIYAYFCAIATRLVKVDCLLRAVKCGQSEGTEVFAALSQQSSLGTAASIVFMDFKQCFSI